MNKKLIVRLLAATLTAGSMSSCLYVTKIDDEPKLPVSFASAEAAQMFYDKTYVPKSNGQDVGFVGLGLTMPKISKKEGSQLRFNNAARAADANGDQTISVQEAKAYAGKSPS